MKYALFFGMFFCAITALAGPSGHEELNQAIANCPLPNNPVLNGLYALRGNAWGQVMVSNATGEKNLEQAKTIGAEVIFDPRLQNSAVGQPSRFLGMIELTVGRQRLGTGHGSGTRLECILKVRPRPL